MTTEKAINHLVEVLKNDENYRRSWSANIAMAYIDNENWYKKKENKRYLSRKDKHTIANNAAEYFLNLLCK